MSGILVTGMDSFEDQVGDLYLINPDSTYRPRTFWNVPRWWGSYDSVFYESCVKVENTEANETIYISSRTKNPRLQIDYNAGVYEFDSRDDREHVDRIAIMELGTFNLLVDVQVPLAGPISPASGTPPVPPITVVTATEYDAVANNYTTGLLQRAYTAVFTGGSAGTVYRWRMQERPSASDSWSSTSWTQYDNTAQEVLFTPTVLAGGQIRIQSQGRDDTQDPVLQTNSNAPVKTVT